MFAIVVAKGHTMVVSWWLGQRCWVGEVVGGHICARGSRFSSLCGRETGLVFSGDELAADGYARVRRGEGRGGSCARGGGDGLPVRGADEGWSFTLGELVGGGQLFSPCGMGGELGSRRATNAGRPDASRTDKCYTHFLKNQKPLTLTKYI